MGGDACKGVKNACLRIDRWWLVKKQVVEEAGRKWENTKEYINKEHLSYI